MTILLMCPSLPHLKFFKSNLKEIYNYIDLITAISLRSGLAWCYTVLLSFLLLAFTVDITVHTRTMSVLLYLLHTGCVFALCITYNTHAAEKL